MEHMTHQLWWATLGSQGLTAYHYIASYKNLKSHNRPTWNTNMSTGKWLGPRLDIDTLWWATLGNPPTPPGTIEGNLKHPTPLMCRRLQQEHPTSAKHHSKTLTRGLLECTLLVL